MGFIQKSRQYRKGDWIIHIAVCYSVPSKCWSVRCKVMCRFVCGQLSLGLQTNQDNYPLPSLYKLSAHVEFDHQRNGWKVAA